MTTPSTDSRSSGVVFLAGPPGAGKTTAAVEAAKRLGVASVDLDDLVESMTGRSPAELIQLEGEAAFRSKELEALQALGPEHRVVALGGGTLTRDEARAEARAKGVIVGLDVPPAALSARLTEPANEQAGRRPLLRDASVDAVQALLNRRRRTYATVDRQVDATAPIETVSDSIVEAVNDVHIVRATIGGQSSRVLIGRGLEQSLLGAVTHLAPRRPVVAIVDGNVPQAVRDRWLAPLEQFFEVVTLEGPGGEAMKAWSHLGQVLETALKHNAGRQSVVVGFGGGATCDLAAMAAALLGRGAPLVLVPTTLLSQVDASVGGKAAVNASVGRNLIGVFHAATDVLVDPDTLESLPAEELRSGLAELVKMAALFDEALFEQTVGRAALTPRLIARAIQLKADVVLRDPYERNERKLLNFGHTLAHGIESASSYEWRHGDAVAAGMAAVARWSTAEGWMSAETRDRLIGGLKDLGLPVGVPHNLLRPAVDFLGHDKKAAGDKITVVTLQSLAQPNLREISLDSVRQAMIQHGGEQ